LRDLDGLSFAEAAEKAGHQEKVKTIKKGKEPFIHPEIGKPDRIYWYVDENGKRLFFCARFEHKGPSGEKTFKQGQPDGLTWTTKEVRLVLYDLPLIPEKPGIAFVEGEKCVQALKSIEVPATTNPMGAGKLAKQQEDHNILEPLRDKHVFIFPDNDKAGKEHAEECARLLQGIAAVVKIVVLPDLPPKGDVVEWIANNPQDTKTKLAQLVSHTAQWRPPSSFMDVTDLLQLTSNNHVPIMRGGILPAGEHLLIAGASGVGKSLLRLELAIHLAMGWQWLGKFEIPQARTVAIFQYENSVYNEQLRFKKMVEGLKIDQFRDGRIKFIDRIKRPNLSKVGDRESLERWVREAESEVVIYDCLSNIHSANENDNIKMREVLDILSDIDVKCNTSSILIHHFGKEQDSDNPRPNISRIRGASSLQDWASTIMSFAYTPNKEHKPIFELRVLKLREGPLHKWQNPLYFERDEFFICHPIEDPCACTAKQVRELLEKLGGSAGSNDLNEQVQDFAMCGKRQAYRFIKAAELERKIFSNKSGRNMVYSTSIYGEIGDK
jgi:5S rRNA maturation endonuclease (ribonuclease M5)